MAERLPGVILTENVDGIVTVTLNRPEAMNVLSAERPNALITTFRWLHEDDSCDVIVLMRRDAAAKLGAEHP